MQAKDKLNRCPFCGNDNKDKFVVFVDNGSMVETDEKWKVFNIRCSCGAMGADGHTREEAIERWNNREGLVQSEKKQLLRPNPMHRGRKYSLYQVAGSIEKTITSDETLMETTAYDPEVIIFYTDSLGLQHKIVIGLKGESERPGLNGSPPKLTDYCGEKKDNTGGQ
jgi:hypothetical protein